jgi:hypothetical protein
VLDELIVIIEPAEIVLAFPGSVTFALALLRLGKGFLFSH